MKKSIKIIPLLILSFLVIIYSNEISINIINTFDIFKNNIFPSIFPFLIISKILINYGFTPKLFKLNPNYTFVFIMSLISGFPSSAKYIKELEDEDIISKEEGNNLILFTHFSSPAFIIITLSSNFLKNKSLGYLILFSHYITNFILILLLHKKKKPIKNYKIKSKSFSKAINNAINDSINTLFLILGTLVTYSILTSLINKLPINLYLKSIINAFIELTTGLKQISILNIPLKLKAALSTFFLSFGGFAIHTQVTNILEINYKKYLFFRVLHAIISFIITYLLFNLIYRL